MDISIIIPAVNEKENLSRLIPILKDVLGALRISYEILIIDGGSDDGMVDAAKKLGAYVLFQKNPGYAGALKTGFREAKGDYILTLDADLSHYPSFIKKMWNQRHRAETVIASRYIRGSAAYMPFLRKFLSKSLNLFFSIGLSLPIKDLSSGFRLYNANAVKTLQSGLESKNFEILEEILIKIYMQGFHIMELPFTYYPREHGSSHARTFTFGVYFLKTFFKMWKLRNSIKSADYEERAFYSRIPPQRYWQRKRHNIITSMARPYNNILDIGCGSSMILPNLNNAVGLDIALNKLRYMRRYNCNLVNGDIIGLPFHDEAFDCVICSQVIEHVLPDNGIFCEMRRVLKPRGVLILGTPDYDTMGWRVIEPLYGFFLPGGYGDEHITHYNKKSLTEKLSSHHFVIEGIKYVLRSELILKCRRQD